MTPPSETLVVQEQTHEEQQIQNSIAKNSSLVAKNMVVEKYCHSCPEKTKMTNPVSYEFESGLTVNFCNENELNEWKAKCNIS